MKKEDGRGGSSNFFSPSGSSSLGTENSLLATLNAWSRLAFKLKQFGPGKYRQLVSKSN